MPSTELKMLGAKKPRLCDAWQIPAISVITACVVCVCVCVCRLSRVQLFVIPCMVARQFPLSMGFFKQKYWSGLPCPPPGDLPDPGIELESLMSPALAGRFFTTSATWEAR